MKCLVGGPQFGWHSPSTFRFSSEWVTGRQGHSRPRALKPKCRWPAALRGLGEDGGRGPGLWAPPFLQAGRPWKLLYEVDHLEPCLGVGRRAGRGDEGQASSLLPLPTQPGSPSPYRTRPLVFRSTEAAKLWVTPTRLVPSTSTRRSFTWILGEATLVRGGCHRNGSGGSSGLPPSESRGSVPTGSWYFI